MEDSKRPRSAHLTSAPLSQNVWAIFARIERDEDFGVFLNGLGLGSFQEAKPYYFAYMDTHDGSPPIGILPRDMSDDWNEEYRSAHDAVVDIIRPFDMKRLNMICDALEENQNLYRLNLWCKGEVDPFVVHRLADRMKEIPGLKTLFVNSARSTKLWTLLRDGLESLVFVNCSLGGSNIVQIAEALRTNTTLTELSINWDDSITDVDVGTIYLALSEGPHANTTLMFFSILYASHVSRDAMGTLVALMHERQRWVALGM